MASRYRPRLGRRRSARFAAAPEALDDNHAAAAPEALDDNHAAAATGMTAIPGTSIAESLRLGRVATKALRALPVVHAVAQRVGRAELVDDVYGTHYSEFEVDLKPLSGDEAEAAQADTRFEIDVRGVVRPAVVKTKPLYRKGA